MYNVIIASLNTLLGLSLICISSYEVGPEEAVIQISEIRSAKGNIIIQVYRDETGYEHQQPYKQFTFSKTNIKAGAMMIKFPIDAGKYGLTLLDDENSNGKMDKNFIGMPKEGFGFSDFFMETLKKPKFEQFQIDIKKTKSIAIRIKYI